MKCPKCGGQELTTLESRRNKPLRSKSPYSDNPELDRAVQKAVDSFGDNWPRGLLVDLGHRFGVPSQHISYRKQVALEIAGKPSDRINTAQQLIRQINAPFIRRRRECMKCRHRFTTYELHEADLSELRPSQPSDEYSLDGYTVMKAYTKAIRTLEQSMEQSLKSAKGVD